MSMFSPMHNLECIYLDTCRLELSEECEQDMQKTKDDMNAPENDVVRITEKKDEIIQQLEDQLTAVRY